MEHVTSVDDVPGASTSMRHPQIAAQCCARTTGTCRRFPIGGGCIAGPSGNQQPPITPMTYGENVAKCEALGLTMCEQSCAGTGCYYNRHPVFTSIPCTEPPSSPPTPIPVGVLPPAPPYPIGVPGPSPPPTSSPPSPPPAPPPIPAAPWSPSVLSPVVSLPSEGAAAFLQRCMLACAQADSCIGFTDTPCSGSRCCHLQQSNPTNGFFLTSPTSYVKHGVSGSQSKVDSARLNAAGVAMVRANPWDDSYGGGVDVLSANFTSSLTATAVDVSVELNLGMLVDWRVVASTLLIFCLGLFFGAAARDSCSPATRLSSSRRDRAISKAVDVAGPPPAQGEAYITGAAQAGSI